jgi:hypothetical protein
MPQARVLPLAKGGGPSGDCHIVHRKPRRRSGGYQRTALSVTFQTDTGPPSVQTLAKVDVFNADGTVAGNVTVTWNGTGSPEPTPVVRPASAATDGWRLDVSHGGVTQKPSVVNGFDWVRDATMAGITATASLIDPGGNIAAHIDVQWE